MDNEIPKILHAVWFDEKDILLKTYPQDYRKSMILRKITNPEFQERMWCYTDVKEAMCKSDELSPFIPFFQYISPLQNKLNFAKLIVVYLEGGVYADVDFVFKKSLASLIKDKEEYFVYEPIEHMENGGATMISNTFFAAKKHHAFLLGMVKYIQAQYIVSNLNPSDISGAVAMARFYKQFSPKFTIHSPCEIFQTVYFGDGKVSRECLDKNYKGVGSIPKRLKNREFKPKKTGRLILNSFFGVAILVCIICMCVIRKKAMIITMIVQIVVFIVVMWLYGRYENRIVNESYNEILMSEKQSGVFPEMPIHILNMPEKADRKEYMTGFLNRLGVKSENIKFTGEGSGMLWAPLDRTMLVREREITDSLVGMKDTVMSNAVNHIRLVKKIADSGKMGLILEDDIMAMVPENKVCEIINGALDDLPPDPYWDMLYLEYCFEFCSMIDPYGKYLHKMYRPLCAAAIIYSAEGAKRVHQLCSPVFDTLDVMYGALIKKGKIQAYGVRPVVFGQDSFWGSAMQRGSERQKGTEEHALRVPHCADAIIL